MDKYEFKLKVDEMKALVSARNYNAAAGIAETINWKKIRNLNALVLAGEVFEQVGRYEESKEILLMAYDKSPIGRNIIYRLAEIAIKTKNFEEAKEYYEEFVDIAPHDNLKFVLKYKMTAAQGLPYEDQIGILEELKEQEYSEEWAYELAYLYHRNGQPDKCVEACDELILWFGDGIYVEKALELKMHYQPLTKPQEEKYRLFRQKRTGVIEVKPDDFLESGEIVNEAVQIPSVVTNAGRFNTANLQNEIAKGMQQIINAKGREDVSDAMDNILKAAEEIPYLSLQEDGEMEAARQQEIEFDDEIDRQLDQSMQMILGEEQKYMTQNLSVEQDDEPGAGEDDPASNPMSIDEILAEWERTKQATQAVLREADERKLESAKEKALGEAEALLDRLMDIMPQLTAGVTPKELLEQEYLQGTGVLERQQAERAKSGITDDTGEVSGLGGYGPGSDTEERIEEAGKIVAGMNKLLQEQIDHLTAGGETIIQEAEVIQQPVVSDPTRELPELSSDTYAEDQVQEGMPPDVYVDDQIQKEVLLDVYADNKRQEEMSSNIYADNRMPSLLSLAKAPKFRTRAQLKKEIGPEEDLYEDEGSFVREIKEKPREKFPETIRKEIPEERIRETAEEGILKERIQETAKEEIPEERIQETAKKETPEERIQQAIREEIPDTADRIVKAEEGIIEDIVEEKPVEKRLPETIGAVQDDLQEEDFTEEDMEAAAKEAGFFQDSYRTEVRPDDDSNRDDHEDGYHVNNRHDGYDVPVKDDTIDDEKTDHGEKQLTEEQKEIFSCFVPITGMEVQLYDLIKGVSEHLQWDKNSLSGNFIIEGISGSGKTMLTMDIIKVLQNELGRPNNKVGKINANALNQKDTDVLTEKVNGGCLIIESAGKISRETAVKLSHCMEQDNAGTLYVLEDTKEGIQKALERDSAFAAKFTEKITIPVFTIDDLVGFGRAYANDLDYDIDELGILALYKRISSIQKLDHVTTLDEVKEIVDEAIENAEKGTLKKMFGILTATRYNDDKYVVLHEKDFEE